MKKSGSDPNFFCSIPYWVVSGSRLKTGEASEWIETDDVCLTPPQGPISVDFIWSDFNEYCPGPEWQKEFLDWEYLYDPISFQNLSGKKWRKFRKNRSKWADLYTGTLYTETLQKSEEINALLLSWFEWRGVESIHDPEIIYQLCFSDFPGLKRKFIRRSGQLFGINIWDENYRYVNYRFCISMPGEPFLDEYMRWLFYTDPVVVNTGKLVNDGGSLGNESLEWFKDKLNPVRKRAVYSWKKV